jgi:DNA-binding beta-propeller fold protein YncE
MVSPVDHTHNLLYVADRDNHAVEVISLAGDTLVNQIPLLPVAPLACPVGVSVDQVTFDLYVADDGQTSLVSALLGGRASAPGRRAHRSAGRTIFANPARAP